MTATRSKEVVNRVPLSVQTFIKEDMEKAGVRQFEGSRPLKCGADVEQHFHWRYEHCDSRHRL